MVVALPEGQSRRFAQFVDPFGARRLEAGNKGPEGFFSPLQGRTAVRLTFGSDTIRAHAMRPYVIVDKDYAVEMVRHHDIFHPVQFPAEFLPI